MRNKMNTLAFNRVFLYPQYLSCSRKQIQIKKKRKCIFSEVQKFMNLNNYLKLQNRRDNK